jgi:hypothetical protein
MTVNTATMLTGDRQHKIDHKAHQRGCIGEREGDDVSFLPCRHGYGLGWRPHGKKSLGRKRQKDRERTSAISD